MRSNHPRVLALAAIAALILFACNLSVLSAPVPPTPGAGDYVATVAALQTRAVETASAQGYGAALTPSPTATLPPAVTGAPQEPIVIRAALCWRGPGPQYEVISSLQPGTQVSLLGRGAISGWFVVRNPIYGDPCWLEATDLQMSANVDIGALPIYNPPWTPTVTPQPTSAISATPPPPTVPPSATSTP